MRRSDQTKAAGRFGVATALLLAAMSSAHGESALSTLSECRLEHPLHLSSITARCGLLQVPLDREHPQIHIGLSVAVVPALNRRSHAAPLFLLAGGPGQGARAMYATLAAAFAVINRDHDIVLVDQRGTGDSHPLSCDYPEEWQEPANPLPQLRQATGECLAKFGPQVRFFTTSEAVRDLDEVRAALGYPQIDLYAASYGTRVAQLYMRRYPQRTHAVILDGVTYPEQIIGPETPVDAERALQQIIVRCSRAPDCHQAYPQLAAELAALLRRFGEERVSLRVEDPSSAQPRPFEFTRTVLHAALRFLSYNANQAALLPALIHEAAQGEFAALAAQTLMTSRQIDQQIASGMQYTVLCSEDVPWFGAAHIDRSALAKTYQGLDQLDALEEICKLWPRGPVDPDLHQVLHSDVPTLLLSGDADPVTPPAGAERAALALSRHRHLILNGEGHGQLATGCVPRLMAQFLLSVDPQHLDAECLQRHVSQPFFVTLSGPSP